MEYTYEIIELELGGTILKRTDSSDLIAWIPIDEGNSDYQAYLNKDKPKTPLVIDETPAE